MNKYEGLPLILDASILGISCIARILFVQILLPNLSFLNRPHKLVTKLTAASPHSFSHLTDTHPTFHLPNFPNSLEQGCQTHFQRGPHQSGS